MAEAKDYYAILGVGRDATDDEIRHAYRKMALKHHPDKNPNNKEEANQKFQAIAEAFDVLGDKEKKEVYDKFGVEGLESGFDYGDQHQQGYTGFTGNPEEFFAQFFNNGGVFGDQTYTAGGGATPKPSGQTSGPSSHLPKAPPVVHDVPLTLEELFAGVTKKMKVTRIRNGVNDSTVLQFDVRRGWKAGTKITFENEGDDLPNFTPSDIVFVIQEKPHALFKRHGSHLLHEVKVTLKQALTGFAVEVMGIDGQKLRIRVKPLQSSVYRKVVIGHGMPFSKKPDARGDLILNFVIDFPTNLPQDKLQSLLACL
ncbi:J domain-containing protein [Plasmodiophora brassicae]|nr:hypothetical protein PBRA_008574 [Plasmodiophora brassicae]